MCACVRACVRAHINKIKNVFFSKSYRSSKNRRKQARKLLNLKHGSMFEDLGLIHALYQIINNAYKDRGLFIEVI